MSYPPNLPQILHRDMNGTAKKCSFLYGLQFDPFPKVENEADQKKIRI